MPTPLSDCPSPTLIITLAPVTLHASLLPSLWPQCWDCPPNYHPGFHTDPSRCPFSLLPLCFSQLLSHLLLLILHSQSIASLHTMYGSFPVCCRDHSVFFWLSFCCFGSRLCGSVLAPRFHACHPWMLQVSPTRHDWLAHFSWAQITITAHQTQLNCGYIDQHKRGPTHYKQHSNVKYTLHR